MPKYIIKLEDNGTPYYLEWSTIVDAPVTYGLPLDEFRRYCQKVHGFAGVQALEERLKRVESKGCSSLCGSLEDLLLFNRAGDNEERLTKEQIVEKYVRNRPKE